MKKLFFCLMATVGLLCASCNNNDEENNWISMEYANDLVGTWTTQDSGYAEALVITEDGVVSATGSYELDYWDVKGRVILNSNEITLDFKDKDNFNGTLEIAPGDSLVLVDDETGKRTIYNYCTTDYTEIVKGAWTNLMGYVGMENYLTFYNFTEDGYLKYSCLYEDEDTMTISDPVPYKVIGDLLIRCGEEADTASGVSPYIIYRLDYDPDYITGKGQKRNVLTLSLDIITVIQDTEHYMNVGISYYRLKEKLDVVGKEYGYSNNYVTNVYGKNKNFDLMGYRFNFARINSDKVNSMLEAVQFSIGFPSEDSIQFNCIYNGEQMSMKARMEIDDMKKMTVKMSERDAAYRDVEMYVFQDAYDYQVRMIMKTDGFTNFFTNMCIAIMSKEGKLDKNDKEAVDSYFTRIDEAIDCINVGFTMENKNK
jgi:hypothetical protein